MLRKFFQFVLGAIVLTVLAAFGLMMLMDASVTSKSIVGVIGVVALIVMVMMSRSHHRSATMMQDSSFVNQPQLRPVDDTANDRPVMWYKGQPFDFVHNDPTASEA